VVFALGDISVSELSMSGIHFHIILWLLNINMPVTIDWCI